MCACVSVCACACVKGVCIGLLPKILVSLSKFYEIRIGGWLKEILYEAKMENGN